MPRIRKNKKDKEDEKNISMLLPPCFVCEGKASGLHFGVNTCEACKAFFRRCLHRDKDAPLICPAEKKCTIYHQNKFLCPYCRYQKCLRVGMSKDAIKTGRYTLEHKAGLLKQAGSRQPSVSQLPDQGSSPHIIPPDSGMSSNPENTVSNNADPENTTENYIVTSFKGPGFSQSAESLEEITDSVVKAFQVFSLYTEETKAKIHQEQNEYQSQRDLIEEFFGPMQPLTRAEYLEIYRTTGIDIDGRMERARSMLPAIKKSVTNMVKFSRYIPGVTELTIDDQIELVEACGFEWWIINAVAGVDVEEGLFTSFFGITHTKAEMQSNHPPCGGSTIDLFFKMAANIQEMKTDATTDALLAAICVTNGEGRKLTEREKVEDIQYRLIEALSLHLSRTRKFSLKVMHQLLDVANEMRRCRKHDVLGRDNGQYVSPMGAHMAPVIHALICERPPTCNKCGAEPCSRHQHYHPKNVPVFRLPRPMPCHRKANTSNVVQMAENWHLGPGICPEMDMSREMMKQMKEEPPMPIDYSSSKQQIPIPHCGFIPSGMEQQMVDEDSGMPIDYSSCDRPVASPCCLSVSSESADCVAAEVRSRLDAFELSTDTKDGFDDSLTSGREDSSLSPGLNPSLQNNDSNGPFDKWQALQTVCEHFIGECESSLRDGKNINYPVDGEDNQMDVELVDSPTHPLGHQRPADKNMEHYYRSTSTNSETMDDSDRASGNYTFTNLQTKGAGKNEAMANDWLAQNGTNRANDSQGKLLSYQNQNGGKQATSAIRDTPYGHFRGKNIEALNHTNGERHEQYSPVSGMQTASPVQDGMPSDDAQRRPHSYKGKNIEQIFLERRSQTDLYST